MYRTRSYSDVMCFRNAVQVLRESYSHVGLLLIMRVVTRLRYGPITIHKREVFVGESSGSRVVHNVVCACDCRGLHMADFTSSQPRNSWMVNC